MTTDLPGYLNIVCCPRCGGALSPEVDRLRCTSCAATYPILDGIPVLLTEFDEVSRQINEWYESNWSEGQAKRAHEDLSDYGQRYIQSGESGLIGHMARRSGTYFLDLGCGAQPRIEAGRGHRYHVCVDFSLAGLRICRELLGDRGIYVCGSLLEPPLQNSFATTALMAHCLYHIEHEKQPAVIGAGYRLLEPGGELIIMYANPGSIEHRLIKPLRMLKRRRNDFYYSPMSIAEMRTHIAHLRPAGWKMGTMRAVSKLVSQPVFAATGAFGYRLLRQLNRLPAIFASYVFYTLRHP